METKQYESPEMVVSLVTGEDVITASGEYAGDSPINLD